MRCQSAILNDIVSDIQDNIGNVIDPTDRDVMNVYSNNSNNNKASTKNKTQHDWVGQYLH